ncbi:transmembrane domain-containing protein [Vairimorpha necatrix]|uniref:Transmembrane domain-containing protein n=1 Tax=Vairimorpha necatrix TaxID=6039 RepID=A0AAX4JDC4_9MICR
MQSAENLNLYERAKTINTTIKLIGAPNNSTPGEEPEIEEFSANTIETFTLEEFRCLIVDCRKKNVDFILARVTTPDPNDSSTLFNFYYAASELNRVLFKFESERRLLHRMKVRNPLNNSFILGQVYYYKLTLEEIDKCLVEYYFKDTSDERKQKKLRSFSAIFRPKDTDVIQTDSISKETDESILNSSLSLDLEGDLTTKDLLENHQDSVMSKDISRDKNIVYYAKFVGTDDDFLMQNEVRDYFRRNALDENDDFLFEIDRGQNDFFALLESGSEEENEEIVNWKRVLTAHVSMLITLLGICLLISSGPIIVLIALPIAMLFFLSFIGSIFYILFCRRSTFDTLAVQSVEEV